MSFKFHRGDYLSDLVTGLKGVVVSRADSLTACNRYCLQPALDKDGKLLDAVWIDEHRLEYDPANLGKKVTLERAQGQPPG